MAFCAYCGTEVPQVSYKPCPSCGNPTNGAPRPAVPARGTNTAAIVIAVVVGGLFVVAIIGIIAAIAIPNLLTATQRAKQKRTMADLRSLATALEAKATDVNGYPRVESVDALEPLLSPTYIRQMPKKDAWAKELRYECTDMQTTGLCSQYFVGSAGKDGQWEHESLTQYPKGATSRFDCDLVFANGNFVQYPEGTSVY